MLCRITKNGSGHGWIRPAGCPGSTRDSRRQERPARKEITMKVARYAAIPLLLLTIALPAEAPGTAGPAPSSLREAFDDYVRAVQAGDLEGLFRTVTGGEDMFFLTSTGQMIEGREGYRRFHEEWFSERGWEMPVELLRVEEGGDYGWTLAVFHYRQPTAEGPVYRLDSYFTLLWHGEQGSWRVVGDVCTPIQRRFDSAAGGILYTQSQQEALQTFLERRTVRRFREEPVPPEHLEAILNAARHAPTAGNQQPWKFLVVDDRRRLDELKEVALDGYLARYRRSARAAGTDTSEVRRRVRQALEGALSAPVYVAVLADRECPYPDYAVQDATLAAGNLMNAARVLGYGTGFFTTYFPDEVMRPLFGIPERYTVVCFTPIGVPEEWPEAPPKKPLADLVVYGRFPGR
jgi:nitroreductase/ketosteroid isomerase-like protein